MSSNASELVVGDYVEMGKEESDDIDGDSENEYKELIYKFFKFKDYKIRGPKGEARCPFCSIEDTNDSLNDLSLLQHAIRVSESSSSRKQRAKHCAMAKYMAFDLPNEQQDIEKEREDAFHQLRIDLLEMINKFNGHQHLFRVLLIDNITRLCKIFDKSLTEPTFCEMYADFCFHLAKDLPELSVDNEKITFKRLLLTKCQEEFEKGEREEQEANEAVEEGEEKRLRDRRIMLLYIGLTGELYKKKMLTERIMHHCISKLLGDHQNPDEENIEALCKLMSTIGEMIDHPEARNYMDVYFDIMTQLSSNVKLSSKVRIMLRDVIDLRKNEWQQRRKVEGPKKIEEAWSCSHHE